MFLCVCRCVKTPYHADAPVPGPNYFLTTLQVCAFRWGQRNVFSSLSSRLTNFLSVISTSILTAMDETTFTKSPNMFLSSIGFNTGHNSGLEKSYYIRFSQMTLLEKPPIDSATLYTQAYPHLKQYWDFFRNWILSFYWF